MPLHFDNPLHYHHDRYQRMVNRWFVFVISLLMSLQIVLNFTPGQIVDGIIITVFGAVMLFVVGGALIILVSWLASWLSGD